MKPHLIVHHLVGDSVIFLDKRIMQVKRCQVVAYKSSQGRDQGFKGEITGYIGIYEVGLQVVTFTGSGVLACEQGELIHGDALFALKVFQAVDQDGAIDIIEVGSLEVHLDPGRDIINRITCQQVQPE